MPLVGGMFFKDADAVLVSDLADRDLLFASHPHEHSYPHCWRCHTPLLYYALPSWYIRTTAIADQLLAENEKTNWQPPTIKHGRYGEWLREQRRLGAVPDQVLGHPAAAVAVPGRAPDLRRLAGRAVGAGRARPGRPGPAPAVRGRGRDHLPAVRGAGPPGARGDRHLVRLGLDAVRAVRCPAPERGRVRGRLPGPVHRRGARPDQGLVLLADGGRHPGLRPVRLPERAVPWPAGGRARPEDEQAPGQRAGADPADGPARRGRGPLVLRGGRLALGQPQDRPRGAGGDRPQGAADLLEHRLLPGPLRQRRRRAGHRPGAGTDSRGCSRRGPAGAGPVAAQRAARAGPGRHRGVRGVRPGGGRPPDLRVHRRPVQLVRAPVQAPVLGGRRHGRRGGRVRHPA